jgi:2-polyprenyl-3-methyl-5-hydroxy-6-metoxy-1,4-benzoquinol methylase
VLARIGVVCQAYVVPRCHVCSSTRSEPVLRAIGGELRRCASCGFVYLATWEESLARADELYDYYAEIDEDASKLRHSAQNRRRQQQLLGRLGSLVQGKSLLDVGCGDGQLLSTAGDEGWEATGIDLSPHAVRLSRARGLRASKTDFFDESIDSQRFDVIVMSELLEHVPGPQRFMQRAEALLEEGGVLYLTTPNFGSLSRRMLAEEWSVVHPEHVGYFERNTLHAMTTQNTGFRTLEIEARNIAPSTFIAWASRKRDAHEGAAAAAHRATREGADQRLRAILERSRALGLSKTLVNRALSRTGLGDTLVAWLQKPSG